MRRNCEKEGARGEREKVEDGKGGIGEVDEGWKR